MAVVKTLCTECKSAKVVKFGKNRQGKQRYRCQTTGCERKTFILEYKNKGYLPEVKKQIIDMTVNGSGIRDIARVLKISINTILSELKKRAQNRKCKFQLIK
jgi:transposase-like protein